MRYQYKFHEIAQNEYEESVTWYLGKSEKIALGFVDAIDSALVKICANPQRYRKTYKNFHEISLRSYPYTIIYSIEEPQKIILIWRVFHHKRNPQKKFPD